MNLNIIKIIIFNKNIKMSDNGLDQNFRDTELEEKF